MRRPRTSKINTNFKIYIRNISGTSLVAQWLRLQASIAGGEGTKIPDASWRGSWNSSVDKASACNAAVKVKVAQSWETLCNSMDHKVLRILQARLLEWVAFPPSPGDLPRSSDGKESACSAGDPGLIPGSGRSAGEGDGNPLQYSCLENPMDKGAWQATQFMGSPWVRHDLSLSFFYASCHNKREKALIHQKSPW